MGKKLYRVSGWDKTRPIDIIFEKNDWDSEEDASVNLEINVETYGMKKSEFYDLLKNYFGKY